MNKEATFQPARPESRPKAKDRKPWQSRTWRKGRNHSTDTGRLTLPGLPHGPVAALYGPGIGQKTPQDGSQGEY